MTDTGVMFRRSLLLLLSWLLVLAVAGCGFDTMTPEELRLEARSRISEHDYKAAEIHLKNLLRENPDDIEARWLLGDAYMWQWKLDAAYKEMETALALGMAPDAVYPKLARAYYSAPSHRRLLELDPEAVGNTAGAVVLAYQALALMNRDDKRAEAALSRAESLAPDAGDVQLARIMLLLGQGQREAARDRLASISITDPYIHSQVGRIYLRLQAMDQARAHLNAALEAGARYYNIHIDLALIGLATADREAVESHLQQLRAIAPRHPAVDYIKGLLLFTDGMYAQAQGRFERVISTYDEFIPAYMYLGLTHYALNNDQQASDYLERFVHAMHSYYPLDKVRAHVAFRLGDYPRAIQLLERLRQLKPEDVSVLALLGESYLRIGDMDSVRETVNALLEQDPDNMTYRMNLGMLLLDSGQSEAGLAEIDRVVETAPEPLQIRKLVALKLFDRGEVDKAAKLIDSVLAESPDNAEFRELRGMVHASRGETEQAEAAFLAAVDASPGDIGALSNLAVFYLRQGNTQAAETYYRRILTHAPTEPRANLGLARILAQRDETDAAERHIEIALQDGDPRTRVSAANIFNQLGRYHRTVSLLRNQQPEERSGQAGLALAHAYLEQGNYPAADYTLRGLPDAYRERMEYLQLRARTSLALGDQDQAVAAATRVLERDEKHFTALMILSQIALLQGRIDTAASMLSRLERYYPHSSEARMFAAVLESVQGDEQGSIDYFEQLYQQLRMPRLAILLSDKYLKTGAPDRAETILRDWLEQEGEDPEVMAGLARLYIQTEQHDRARALYRRILDRWPDHVAALNNYAMLVAAEHPAEALRHAEKAYFMRRDNPAIKDTYNRMLELNGKPPVH